MVDRVLLDYVYDGYTTLVFDYTLHGVVLWPIMPLLTKGDD